LDEIQVTNWVNNHTAAENSKLLSQVMKTKNFALLNIEGFRKILKKQAKHSSDDTLAKKLLPKLWSAPFHADGSLDALHETIMKLVPEWEAPSMAPVTSFELRKVPDARPKY